MTDQEIKERVDTYWRNKMADNPKKQRRGRVPRSEKIAANEKQIDRWQTLIAKKQMENEQLRQAAKDEAARILSEAGV